MPEPLDLATFFEFGQAWHSAFPDEETTFEDQIAEALLLHGERNG
jgi:hypothetical protein